jgi:hypothetical protein
MPESVTERDNSAPNLGQLLENTLHHGKTLLQAELSLARLQAALTTLGVVLVLAFGVGVAAIALIVVLAGAGTVLVVMALRALERKKLPRTTARLTLDAQEVMETVK